MTETKRLAPRDITRQMQMDARRRRDQQLQRNRIAKEQLVGGVAGTRRWETLTDGATVNVDAGLSNKHKLAAMGGNRTFTISNVKGSQFVFVAIQQDATGSRVPTFWSGISWDGGGSGNTQPTTSAAATEWSIWAFSQHAPGKYFGFLVGDEMPDV